MRQTPLGIRLVVALAIGAFAACGGSGVDGGAGPPADDAVLDAARPDTGPGTTEDAGGVEDAADAAADAGDAPETAESPEDAAAADGADGDGLQADVPPALPPLSFDRVEPGSGLAASSSVKFSLTTAWPRMTAMILAASSTSLA